MEGVMTLDALKKRLDRIERERSSENRIPLQTRVSPEARDRLAASAEKAGRSMAQELELRLEASLATSTTSSQAPSFEDVRLMIREEIRAALAEMCPSGVAGFNRAVAEINERRDFGPRPEALYGRTGKPQTSWKV